MLVQHLDSSLLSHNELVATGRAKDLSPLDLKRRVLLKGKVHVRKTTERLSIRSSSRLSTLRLGGPPSTRGKRTPALGNKQTPVGDKRQARQSAKWASRDALAVEPDGASVRFSQERNSGAFSPRQLSARVSGKAARAQARARMTLHEKRAKTSKGGTDNFFSSYLTLRSEPIATFMGLSPPRWVLPITSMNEDRFLKLLGISSAERYQLEGLQLGRSSALSGFTEEQQISHAVIRLTADPPAAVGKLQRLTAQWLVRPYPAGLRTSGKNMSPLPCWLTGAQNVCLNFSDNDLAVQLHFALFNRFDGYIMKPPEMQAGLSSSESKNAVAAASERSSVAASCSESIPPSPVAASLRTSVAFTNHTVIHERATDERGHDVDDYWPPPRESISCTTMHLLSLVGIPKYGERRPAYNGSRGSCHGFHPELSGAYAPPDNLEPSTLGLVFSIHPIGGFCAISTSLPLPKSVDTEAFLPPRNGGMNAAYQKDEMVHCLAAEPQAAFLRISLADRGKEVAYETVVLGRLRGGFRVIRMRSMLGTRIELAYLFVRIVFSHEPNMWPTTRQLRLQNSRRLSVLNQALDKVAQLEERLQQQGLSRRESDEFDGESLSSLVEQLGRTPSLVSVCSGRS